MSSPGKIKERSSSKSFLVLRLIAVVAVVVALDAALKQPIEMTLRSTLSPQTVTKVLVLRVVRPTGLFLVHYSDVMEFGKHQEVICRVAFGDVDIHKDLDSSPSDIVQAIDKRVDAMKVSLSGESDLGVRMISNDEQRVSQAGITQWVADLSPHKPGNFRLYINAAFLKPDAHEGRMATDWYDQGKDIRVAGALKYDLFAFWDKVSSEVLTAAVSTIATAFVLIGLGRAGIKKPPEK